MTEMYISRAAAMDVPCRCVVTKSGREMKQYTKRVLEYEYSYQRQLLVLFYVCGFKR